MSKKQNPRMGDSQGRFPSDQSGSGRPERNHERQPSSGSRILSGLSLRQLDPRRFELVHPPCVERVMEDYLEALDAWRMGEPEEAKDMLRFALEGCGDHLWVHCALGRMALEVENNRDLARGHFGYAFELVSRVIPQGFTGFLPVELPGNEPLYQAIEGLISCEKLAGGASSRQVVELERTRTRLSGSGPGGASPMSLR